MREPIIPEFDAETYLMWEDRQRERHELHHGFVVSFAGGTLDHDQIAHNLYSAFDRLFPAPCRAFGSDVKVKVDPQTFFYPDAGVVCGEHVVGTATWFGDPRVVAEVLSPSTRAYDLIEKRAAYRQIPSLDAYLIVHTDITRIELDLRDGRTAWRTSVFENESIPLGSGQMSFEEVYYRTSLLKQ